MSRTRTIIPGAEASKWSKMQVLVSRSLERGLLFWRTGEKAKGNKNVKAIKLVILLRNIPAWSELAARPEMVSITGLALDDSWVSVYCSRGLPAIWIKFIFDKKIRNARVPFICDREYGGLQFALPSLLSFLNPLKGISRLINGRTYSLWC